ncbi:MAG: SpoVA/SpoVAEb family sporulation membrane protein [Clostridia bacterium]|nr:SpoVA/SpoVAEb family sporulation membrane protein [Clostridia bacterium]
MFDDPLIYLKVFLVGGLVCMIGQILIITTQMTSARILVSFLLLGAFLEIIGVYQTIYNFAGAGIAIPITGFGASLARGAIDAGQNLGLIGVLTGGLTATAGGIAAAIFAGFVVAMIFNSRTK